jgi:glutamine amidotransferase
VHTYAPRPARGDDVLGTASYGEDFVTAIERPPIYGVQFHPEKSGAHGLRLLSNFTRICGGALSRAA